MVTNARLQILFHKVREAQDPEDRARTQMAFHEMNKKKANDVPQGSEADERRASTHTDLPDLPKSLPPVVMSEDEYAQSTESWLKNPAVLIRPTGSANAQVAQAAFAMAQEAQTMARLKDGCPMQVCCIDVRIMLGPRGVCVYFLFQSSTSTGVLCFYGGTGGQAKGPGPAPPTRWIINSSTH